MRNSLRARLILLYAVVITTIVAVFGATVCYLFWRSLVRQVDGDVQQRAERVARSLSPFPDGTFDLNLPEDAATYFDPDRADRPYYAIWAADGRRIDTSDPAQAGEKPESTGTRTRDGWREAVVAGPGNSRVLVGRRLDAVRDDVWSLAITVGSVGLVAALLSIVGGWLLAGRVLAPIARISRTAREMAGGALDARIPIEETESELGQVAQALNSAFDRLRLASEQLRRFTADASHELRTPVATLCAETEWALSRDRAVDAYRESLRTCQTAALRIGRVVEALLTLARADAQQLHLALAPCRLDNVVEDVATLVRPVAERRDVTLAVDLQPLEVFGDRERLLEAVSNVVFNAVLYNKPGGRVDVGLERAGHEAVLRVRDTGVGIAAEHLPRIFDRFYRADAARASGSGGAGLGLAIARWVVEQHAGQIHCTSTVGAGTEFVIRLPIGRAAATADPALAAATAPHEQASDRR